MQLRHPDKVAANFVASAVSSDVFMPQPFRSPCYVMTSPRSVASRGKCKDSTGFVDGPQNMVREPRTWLVRFSVPSTRLPYNERNCGLATTYLSVFATSVCLPASAMSVIRESRASCTGFRPAVVTAVKLQRAKAGADIDDTLAAAAQGCITWDGSRPPPPRTHVVQLARLLSSKGDGACQQHSADNN